MSIVVVNVVWTVCRKRCKRPGREVCQNLLQRLDLSHAPTQPVLWKHSFMVWLCWNCFQSRSCHLFRDHKDRDCIILIHTVSYSCILHSQAISILAWCCATALQSSIPPLVRYLILAFDSTVGSRIKVAQHLDSRFRFWCINCNMKVEQKVPQMGFLCEELGVCDGLYSFHEMAKVFFARTIWRKMISVIYTYIYIFIYL